MKNFVYYRPVRLGIVLLTLFLVISCNKSKEPLGEDYGIAYLPLRDNQTFTYQRQCGDNTEQVTRELRLVKGDLETPEFRIIEKDGESFDQFLRHQGNAVVYLTEKPLARLEDFAEGQLYLSTWLLDGATNGDYWEDEETGLRTAVAGFESVTVPAGTFEDCIKTVVESTDLLLEVIEKRGEQSGLSEEMLAVELEDAKELCIRWFAWGVGLVKEEKGDCRLELVSYIRE
ncbi:hypothetical protein KKB28_04705 [bacterium]|nr:hypothetical protein [bacterium]